MHCRRATDDDAPALRDLRSAWTEEDHGRIEDPDYDAAFSAWWEAQRDHRRHWIAEAGGAAAGMASVVVVRPMPSPGVDVRPWGYVHHVYVLPEHRGQGVGGILMGAVIEACRADRFRQLLLNPRPRSVPFYERLGFESAGHLLRLGLTVS